MLIRVKSDRICMKKMPQSTQNLSESDFCTSKKGALTLRFSDSPIYATVAGVKFSHSEGPSIIIRGIKRMVSTIN